MTTVSWNCDKSFCEAYSTCVVLEDSNSYCGVQINDKYAVLGGVGCPSSMKCALNIPTKSLHRDFSGWYKGKCVVKDYYELTPRQIEEAIKNAKKVKPAAKDGEKSPTAAEDGGSAERIIGTVIAILGALGGGIFCGCNTEVYCKNGRYGISFKGCCKKRQAQGDVPDEDSKLDGDGLISDRMDINIDD